MSGGVDSMALAYLCTSLKRYDSEFRIADNPVADFRALIVDHRLREGSKQEAAAVSRALKGMGMGSDILTISWAKTLSQSPCEHPKDLPNLESVARKLRYRKLGAVCGYTGITSLLLAHHEDDQYETVLMRLIQGHGVRGLRGMRPASDIPECDGLHGAHYSGYIDDQRNTNSLHKKTMSRKQYKTLRDELKSSIDCLGQEHHPKDDYDFEERYGTRRAMPVKHASIDIEDGGVVVYRPLLEFSKERLIATCEANNVPWWEDGTNRDQTLTMRNALRHMCKGHTLPVALQKSSILALSRRCEQKTWAIEAEANRLLTQTIIHNLEPNVGSASVQFPRYDLSRFPRDASSPLRRDARILRQCEVAGLLIRRIIALVSPEEQPVPLANLQNVISRLFPGLPSSPGHRRRPEPPKAFVIAGVHFVPIKSPSSKGDSLSWYLSRTPYTSTLPIPLYRFLSWSVQGVGGRHGEGVAKWSRWMRWVLWDGRFWIRIRHRLPYRVILQPFARSHAKAFRSLLTSKDRGRLEILLKHYAPDKTRFTLPALYLEVDPDSTNAANPQPYYLLPPSIVRPIAGAERAGEHADPTTDHPRVNDDLSNAKLVALPSLDVRIPHLSAWLEYETRYRRVDRNTLSTAGSFRRASFVPRSLRRSCPPTMTRRQRAKRRRWKLLREARDRAKKLAV